MDFFREFFQPGDLVYDVGAHTGEWTRMLLENGAGMVIAVEPQDNLCRGLVKEFIDKPVRVLHAALGEKYGRAQLYECKDATSLASLSTALARGRFGIYRWRRGEIVNVTTLDSMIREYGTPKFIKIDVEGYELEVLLGLSTPINSVCFEYTRETMFPTYQAIHHLQSLGSYEYSYNLGDYPTFEVDWTSYVLVMKQLNESENPELWGNIYARLRSE